MTDLSTAVAHCHPIRQPTSPVDEGASGVLKCTDIWIWWPPVIAALILVTSLWGCGTPRIRRFDASPPVICDGENAAIHWEADGELGMAVQVRSSSPTSGGCEAVGQDT